MELELFLLLLSAHFVGDFAFQSSWMGIEKARSWEITFYHTLIYTATFVLFRIDLTLLSLIILVSEVFLYLKPLRICTFGLENLLRRSPLLKTIHHLSE